jgi:phosphoglycolate phosphatase
LNPAEVKVGRAEGAARYLAALGKGRVGRSAGPPQARPAPSGGSESHAVGSVGAHFDAAIVDLDGTLVDTLGDFVAALNLMLKELVPERQPPLQVGAAEVSRRIGKGSVKLIFSVLNHLNAQSNRAENAPDLIALYDQAHAGFQRHYAAVSGRHSQVYGGAVEGLLALNRAGLRLACVTNKPLAFARDLLAQKHLDSYFDEVFGGDSFERKKPDPLPFVRTCEVLGSRPERTLVVGDSSNDALAARGAGCPVVLVTYGYNHGEPIEAVDADGFVDSLARLGD